MLTAQRVHMIRTSGLSDRHWERLWRIHARTIRHARIGKTWRDHETPVDDRPRTNAGNWGGLHDNGSGNP